MNTWDIVLDCLPSMDGELNERGSDERARVKMADLTPLWVLPSSGQTPAGGSGTT